MKSDERRAARRARREERREQNRRKRAEGHDLEAVADLDNLYKAAILAKNGVSWKPSVQHYMIHVIRNVNKARKALLCGKDIKRGFILFVIVERGKVRYITAVRFSERVIQKSIAQNALVPTIWPTVTSGCSANVKGRGEHYAIERLKRQLREHYARHGSDGWIMLVDFRDYFGSISHAEAKRIIERAITDRRLVELECDQIDAQGDVGLGLGSEPNQVLAVALPSPIDHAAESMPGIESTGRYMDDSYYISASKGALEEAERAIRQRAESLGITLNEGKTRIVKLSRGFTFLKKRFSYGKDGKVVVRPCRESVTRERRRLKGQARLVEAGEMTVEQVRRSYRSWRGSMKRLAAKKIVKKMDDLFRELFHEEP